MPLHKAGKSSRQLMAAAVMILAEGRVPAETGAGGAAPAVAMAVVERGRVLKPPVAAVEGGAK